MDSHRNRVTSHPSKGRSVAYVINARLLGMTALICAVIVPSAMAWHARQLGRQAHALLERADRLEESQEFRAAADVLGRYLRLCPLETEVRARQAQAFDKAASTLEEKTRACAMYSQVLGQLPQRTELWRRHAELLLETGRWLAAEQQAQRLLGRIPNDAAALRVWALALSRHGATTGQVAARDTLGVLQRAAQANSRDVELHVLWAEAVRLQDPALEAGDPDQAERILDQLVEREANSADAWHARGAYRARHALTGVEEDLQRALALAPDHAESLLLLAQRLANQADLVSARKHYRHAIRSAPTDRRGYLGLSQIQVLLGQPDQARATLTNGLTRVGANDVLLNLQLASIEVTLNKRRSADRRLDRLDDLLATYGDHWPKAERLQLESAIAYWRGLWWASGGRHASAVECFKRSLSAPSLELGLMRQAGFEFQVWQSRAQSHIALEQWDLAAEALEQASTLAPQLARLRLAAGDAWSHAGRWTAAAEAYQACARCADAPESVWLSLARACLQRQLEIAPHDRDWSAFQEALARAQAVEPDSTAVRMLEASFALVEDQWELARELLARTCRLHPDSPVAARALMLAHEQHGDSSLADQVLEEFSRAQPAAIESLLLRAELLVVRQRTDEALALLQAAMPSRTREEQPSILERLAEIAARTDQARLMRDYLEQLRELRPRDVSILRHLAELAVEARDDASAQRIEQQLQAVEGEQGTVWRYVRGLRLLVRGGAEQDSHWDEVAELQSTIRALRPDWPGGHGLNGMLAQARGNQDEALEAYRLAVDLGDTSLGAYERLIGLLLAGGRVEEAETYLARVRQSLHASTALSGMAISASIRRGQMEPALDHARASVKQRAKDPLARVWLGETLQIAGRGDEALPEFREAVRLAPDQLPIWNSLFTFLVRTRRWEQGRETLLEMAGSLKLTAVERELLLARGYQALGDQALGLDHARRAARMAPQDGAVQEQLASFLLNVDLHEAEASLRKAISLAPKSAGARRTLALILATRGNERDWSEASELLNGPPDSDAEPVDLRLRALLLVRRAQPGDREQAQAMLERLVEESPQPLPTDRLMLARIHELEGRLQRAQDQLLTLACLEPVQAEYVANLIDFQLRNSQSEQALAWLEKLESLEPSSLRTIRLRAQWLKGVGRAEEIEPLVQEFLARNLALLRDEATRARLVVSVADLYRVTDCLEAADRAYRLTAEMDPNSFEPLLAWLLDQRRYSEAIATCAQADAALQTAQPAVALGRVCMECEISPADEQTVEQVFARAIDRHPDQAGLYFALANVRYKQRRLEEARELFRRVLGLEPRHLGAMNNLAMLLSEEETTRSEARSMLEQALDIAGMQGKLLDTQGLILARAGEMEHALRLLRQANHDPAATFTHRMHLALALVQSSQMDEAVKISRRAGAGSLSSLWWLTNGERQQLDELQRAPQPPAAGVP